MKHLSANLDNTTNIEVPLTPSARILGLDPDNNVIEIQGTGGGGDTVDDNPNPMDGIGVGDTYCYTASNPLSSCYVIGADVRITDEDSGNYFNGCVTTITTTPGTPSQSTADCGGWEEGDPVAGTYWEWEIVSQTLGTQAWGSGGSFFDHGIDWGWTYPNGQTVGHLIITFESTDGIYAAVDKLGIPDASGQAVNTFVGRRIYGRFSDAAEDFIDANSTPLGGTYVSDRGAAEGTTTLRKVRKLTNAPAPQKWVALGYKIDSNLPDSEFAWVEQTAVFPIVNTTVRFNGENYYCGNGFYPAGEGIYNNNSADSTGATLVAIDATYAGADASATAGDGVYRANGYTTDQPTNEIVCDGSHTPTGSSTESTTEICIEVKNVTSNTGTFDVEAAGDYTIVVTCPGDVGDGSDGDGDADGDTMLDGETVNCPPITSNITYDGGATLATPTVYADFTTSNFTTQQNNLQEASQDNPGKLPGVLSIQTNNYKNKFNNNTTPAQAAANLITMNSIRAALGQNALNADGSVGAAQAVSTIEVIGILGSVYTVTATVNNGRTLAPLQRFYVGSTKYVIDTVTPNGTNFDITVTASVHGTTVEPITASNTQIPVTDDIVFGRWTSFYGTYFEFEVATADYYPYNPGFGLDNRYLYLQYAPDVDTEDERNNITGGIGTSGNATVLLNKSLLVAGSASNPIAASGTVMFTVDTADINYPSYAIGTRLEVTVSSAGLTTSFEGNIDSIVPVSGDATRSIITLGNLTLTTDIDTTTSFSVTEIKCADGTGMVIINEDGDTMLGDLFVDGDETVDGDLTVDGDGMFTGDLDGDNIKADGDLDVDGDANIDGDLGVGGGLISSKDCTDRLQVTTVFQPAVGNTTTIYTFGVSVNIPDEWLEGDIVNFYADATTASESFSGNLSRDITADSGIINVIVESTNVVATGLYVEVCPATGTLIVDGDPSTDGDVEIDGDGNIDADGDINADGDIMADGDISGGGSLGGSIVPCPENDAAVLNFFNNISTLTIDAGYSGERNLGKFDFFYSGLPSGLAFSDQTFGINVAWNPLASSADLQGRFIVLRPNADGAWGNADFGMQQKDVIYSLVKDASDNFVLNKPFPTTPGTYQIAIGNGDFAPGWCVINEFGVAEEVTIGSGTTRIRDGLIVSTGGLVIHSDATTTPTPPATGLSLGTPGEITRIFGTSTIRTGPDEPISAGGGNSYNFLAVGPGNELLTSPDICSTDDGGLEMLGGALRIDTTTTLADHDDKKLIAFNLGTNDATFSVHEGKGGQSILTVGRADADNTVVIGTSSADANLSVTGDFTLTKETTAGFLTNSTAGIVTSTTDGSSLTGVNAATVDNVNTSAAEPTAFKYWSGTLTEYNAINTKADDTIYNVKDAVNVGDIDYGGNVTIQNTLTVGGASALNGGTTTTTLTASGHATLNGGAQITGNASVSGVSTLTGGIAPNGGETTIAGIKFWAGERDEFQALFNDLSGVLDANTIYNYPGPQITTTT